MIAWPVFWLVVVVAGAGETLDVAAHPPDLGLPSAAEGSRIDTLPDALPPLDEALLQGPSSADDVTFFGQGRVLVGAENPAIVNDLEPIGGAALTGRVGVAGRIGDLRAAVVVGDGAWWTTPVRDPTLELVPRPLVAPLHRLSLEVPVGLLGAPGLLVLGRFALVVADGRLVGSEPFDARGRTVDGAVVDVELWGVHTRAGAVVLDLGAEGDPGAADPRVDAASGLAFLAAGSELVLDPALHLVLDAYGLLHHTGVDRVLRPTLGARALVDVVGLRWRGGVDGQLALDEEQGLAFVDNGVHAEVAVTTQLPWSLSAPRPFLEMGVEGTTALLAPAPSRHGTLGELDLVDFANTWQARAAIGVDDPQGFALRATWRLVSSLGLVHGPGGGGVIGADPGTLFNEVDVALCVPIDDDVGLDVAWAVAVGRGALPPGPAQRLIVGLRFSFGDDDGLLASF